MAVNVRVGNQSDDIGLLRGFENNPLCATIPFGLSLDEPQMYYCDKNVTGQYLSIDAVVNINVSQLVLCQVEIS